MAIGDLIRSATNGMLGIQPTSSELLRQLPEPRNSAGQWASSVANTLGGAASSVLGAAGGLGSSIAGGDFKYLLDLQTAVQKEMAEVSMLSNISKSKHETEMAPIRNLRVG